MLPKYTEHHTPTDAVMSAYSSRSTQLVGEAKYARMPVSEFRCASTISQISTRTKYTSTIKNAISMPKRT